MSPSTAPTKTAAAPAARTLFDRMEAVQIKKEPILSRADCTLVADAHSSCADALTEIREVERKITALVAAGNAAAGKLLKDSGDTLEGYRRRAISDCYSGICRKLNARYGTRFEGYSVFGEDWPVDSRYAEVPDLLTKGEIAQKVAGAVGAVGLEAAGTRAVVDFFREQVTSRQDPRIGKTYIGLPGFFYFDQYFENQLSYHSREAVRALAKALWFFEKGIPNAPSGFLSDLTNTHTEVDTGSKLPLPEHFTRAEAITIYKNGTLKIHFRGPEHTRAFAGRFELV